MMAGTGMAELHFRSKLHHHSYASDVGTDTRAHTHTLHTHGHTLHERNTHTHTHTHTLLLHDTHTHTLLLHDTHTHTLTLTHSTHNLFFFQSLLLILLFPSVIAWYLLVSFVCVPIFRSIGTRQL